MIYVNFRAEILDKASKALGDCEQGLQQSQVPACPLAVPHLPIKAPKDGAAVGWRDVSLSVVGWRFYNFTAQFAAQITVLAKIFSRTEIEINGLPEPDVH